MTGKADFTEQEWETVLEGPTSAGLIVSTAQRGGSFRESFSLAKAYAEARTTTGASGLMDEIAKSKPKVDRARQGSAEELKEHHLSLIREAVSLLEAKASPGELEDYRRFTLSLAERVARAKEEGDQPVSDAERAAIDEISGALGEDSG
jgi:DNA-binding transcriptional regulator GbsR (MarR family)